MNTHTWSIFPTPVTKFTDVFNDRQLTDISNYLNTLNTAPHTAIDGDGESSHDEVSDITKAIASSVPSCSDIEGTIQRMLDEYTYNCGIDNVRVVNSWHSIQRPGSRLVQHFHANSIVSGVLYVNTDSQSSKIFFDNPNKMVAYTNQTTRPTEFNFEYFYVQPEKGDVLLFPSWLMHGSASEYNQSQCRQILSFNARYQ